MKGRYGSIIFASIQQRRDDGGDFDAREGDRDLQPRAGGAAESAWVSDCGGAGVYADMPGVLVFAVPPEEWGGGGGHVGDWGGLSEGEKKSGKIWPRK